MKKLVLVAAALALAPLANAAEKQPATAQTAPVVKTATAAKTQEKTAAKPAAKADKMETSAIPASMKTLPPGLYVEFKTGKGDIIARLFEDKAPKTVANFTDLAEGRKEWTDPMTGQKKKSRFFDGLTFMRVIPGFMIQGGDPLNNCTGGPGYKFADEFNPALSFDKPGLLAMANSGPNTNGSQFFITDDPRGGRLPGHLTNHHAIFGEVVVGMKVVSAIADTPAEGGMAFSPVKMTSVNIIRIPTEKK